MSEDESRYGFSRHLAAWIEVGGSWQKYAKTIPEAEKLKVTNDYLGVIGWEAGEEKLFTTDELLVCFKVSEDNDRTKRIQKIPLETLIKAYYTLQDIRKMVE